MKIVHQSSELTRFRTQLRCDHCLLTFPEKDAVYDRIDGEDKVFCCHGCQGIYRLIHSEGLDDFYKKRKWDKIGISRVLFEKELDIKPFAEYVRDIEVRSKKSEVRSYKEIDIFIDNIRCASCVWLNEKILGRTDGIEYVRVNYATHRAKIRWNPEIIGLEGILKRIVSIGYNPKPYSESEQFKIQEAEVRDLLIRFGTAGFLSSQLMIYSAALYAGYFQGIDAKTKLLLEVIAMFLTIPVIFYSGMPFIRNTIRGLRHLNFNMDSLITIGAGSAFIYSIYQIFTGGKVYFDTSAMIITLILLGRYIEATAKGKASETIRMLIELVPKEATKIEYLSADFITRTLPISSIQKGDLILVRPGEKIPLDGIVIEGESEVDESIITGESMPVYKGVGNEVIGGSMNLYGTLVFEVTRTGKDTVLSNVMRAVNDAQTRKPRIQRLADRIVGYFIPAILIVSFLTVSGHLFFGASVQNSIMAGISVLLIACPCSLGLATPLAVLIFTTIASSKGILIKGGEVVENTSRLTHVMFDKTGTITRGKPVLKEIVVFDDDIRPEHALSIAASIERLSEHTLGRAIVEAYNNAIEQQVLNLNTVTLCCSDIRAVPGKGVEGTVNGMKIFIGNRNFMIENGIEVQCPEFKVQGLSYFNDIAMRFERRGDTVVYLGWGGRVRGLFVISDIIRDEALDVVKELKQANLKVSIMSGDNRVTTDSIASMLDIDNVVSEASPVKKKEIIGDIQQRGHRVMMVGDGINDAPALTEASVGVAMGRGTDIAMESADAVLARNDLRLIPYFIRLSRKTYSVIKQNIFWAFFYNLLAIPLAISGVLHPIIAAGAMTVSSLFVVGNSLRIKKY